VLAVHLRSGWADDVPQPAPGEPTGATADEDKDVVQAIKGTQPPEDAANEDTDKEAVTKDADANLHEELAKLRSEFMTRIAQLETRLDSQIARIDVLQQAATSAGETRIANKPAEPTESEDADKDASERAAELARLKSELEQVRTNYQLLLATIDEHAKAIGEQATAIAKQNESLQTQDQQLSETNEKLVAIQEGQQQLDKRLLAASSGEEGNPILGNMQTDASARGELFRAARYRLRIRNTTGQEQPLYVNGVQWTIRADEWTFVPLPLGPVAIRRPDAAPIDVAEDHVQWKSDNRGFYVDYNLDLNQVSVAAEE
jgi:hypothetical protein